MEASVVRRKGLLTFDTVPFSTLVLWFTYVHFVRRRT